MSFPAVVRAFVFNPDGKVLMAQHKSGTPWVLPGGHVESGESIHGAMIRELQEEFSLEARFFDVDHEERLHHRGKKLDHHLLPISIYDLSYTSKDGKDNVLTMKPNIDTWDFVIEMLEKIVGEEDDEE